MQLHTTLCKRTLADLPAMADLAEELAVVVWAVFCLVPTGRGQTVEELTPDEYEATFAWLAERSRTARWNLKLTEGYHFRRVLQQQRGPRASGLGFDSGDGLGRAPRSVNAGNGFCFISHIGDVSPSGFLPLSAGNVRDASVVRSTRTRRSSARCATPSSWRANVAAARSSTSAEAHARAPTPTPATIWPLILPAIGIRTPRQLAPTHGECNMVTERLRVVVVGGGIAGLSAALALQDAGLAVTLVEKRKRLGGVIATECVNNMLLEGGPDALLTAKPAALEAIGRLGLMERVVSARADTGGPLILWRGRLTPMPAGVAGFAPSRFGPLARTPLLSPAGKLTLALEIARPARRGDDDETLGAFFRRRVGRQAYTRLVEPLLGGIYADDLDELSLLGTLPRLRDLERRHGGLARAGLAQRRAASVTAGHTLAPTFVSLRGGLGELVEGYRRALCHCDLRVLRAARSVARDATGYRVTLSNGDVLAADALVLATPAPTAASLLRVRPGAGGRAAGHSVWLDSDGRAGVPLRRVAVRADDA